MIPTICYVDIPIFICRYAFWIMELSISLPFFTKAFQQSVVVVREGVCMITPVDVAFEVGDLTGIANGLQAGDQVVVKDADKIRNEQALSEAERQIILW